MKIFNSTYKQRICKYGFATIMLFMGSQVSIVAQDVTDEAESATEETTDNSISKKKVVKEYETVEIQGKVIDAATGEPLPGAQIHAYNSNKYTAMAGEDGSFTIKVPTFVTSLSTKLEGYNLIRTSLNGQTTGIEIKLYSNQFAEDYVLRTTGSHSVMTKDFESSSVQTIDQEIGNRLGSDVRSIQRSANPGQGMAMFINGFNSLNSNAMPLIILDGVVYDQMYNATMYHTGYFNNLLQSIAMMDIESVEVLKNGTAIYGAKAANGVILINTKRCRSMATRIDVNISGGVELQPNTIDMMNASDYRSYAAQMLGTTDTKLTDFKFLNTDPNYYYYNMYHNNTDWKDVVYREAWTQDYGINIQGGDDIAAYNLSVGYADIQSTLKMNDYTRFNIRFNADIKLNKWISTRFDASYTNITRDLRDDGLESDFNLSSLASTSFLALAKAPFLSPYSFSTDGKESRFISDADDYLYEVLGTKASVANPKAILENGEAKNKNHTDCTMINLAIAPTWRPNDRFALTERFAYTMQSFDESYFTPIEGMPTYRDPSKEAATQNSKYSLYTTHNAVFSDTRADWTLPLGSHRLDIFGGIRFMNDTYTASSLRGDNTGNDKTPNNSTSQNTKKREGSDTSWRSLAYYANVDYNYMEKYYLQGQLSMETSSRFGRDVEGGLKLGGVSWGIFPSIQGSWVISNEKWFRPTKAINMLKFNVGFESVGNDAIDNSATLTYLSSKALLNNTVTSIGLGNIGNESLRWETTNRFNFGIEGNFFNNRLNLRANYYTAKTTNLVTLGTLSYVAGLNDYYTNDGEMKNNGFDFAFNAKLINSRNFKFELGASLGHFKTELTKLPQGMKEFETDMFGGTILSRVGESAGVFYGYKTDGVYSTKAEANADGKYIVDNTGAHIQFGAGDMKFVDTNNDSEINELDRVIIGDPTPDIYGNIHANFHIGKNWAISTTFNYTLGNDIYNYQRALLESGSMFINQTTAVNRRWFAEGQLTDVPRAVYGDPMGNSRFSDRWIEDGSYFKFKNITVSYKVPIQNMYIQGITVWAAANNLFTLTKYLGADPEVSAGNSVLMQGIDAGYLTSGRSFHLGVKINL